MSIGSITTSFISKLGNTSDSIVPLLAKDTTCNFLISNAYEKNGGKRDGKERLIEEFGTEALWIFGIPFSKKLFNNTVYKIANINPEFDVRKLNANTSDNVYKMMENLPKDSKQYADLDRIVKNQGLAKGLTIARFATTTIATLMALRGLIKFKQNQTRLDIEKENKAQNAKYEELVNDTVQANPAFTAFVDEKEAKNNPNFKGGVGAAVADFMFNPVKNMSILDGGISLTRFKEARKGELPEVFLKEIGTIAFYYILGAPIQKAFDKMGEKVFKVPSNLDYNVLSNQKFKELIKGKDSKKAFADFLELSDEDVIKKAMTSDDAIVSTLKDSGVIKTAKKTGKTNPFVKMEASEIRQTVQNMSDFLTKQVASGVDVDKFISKARKLKAGSIFGNIATSIIFVGVIIPKLTFMMRKAMHGSTNNPAISNVENELNKKNETV